MNAERKYTDRDVRSMSNVHEYVTEYLEHYQGEFDFLVDCKMRVTQGVELSVGMMRGVLNCMRADPRVRTQLPEPLGPDDMGTVVHMRPKRRKSQECTIRELHDEHSMPETEQYYSGYCVGNHLINREYTVTTRATVKVPYLAAVSITSYVHRTGDEAWLTFFPNRHDWGFKNYDPDLSVRPLCKMPQRIKNPILLRNSDYLDMQDNEETSRPRCPRCFK